MGSKTFSQARKAAGAAHDPVFARKVKVPQKLARQVNQEDKASGFLRSALRVKRKKGGKV